jgi:hypothetical protein
MKNIIIALFAVMFLSSCGYANQVIAHIESYTLVCVKETGVMYVQFPTGVAPLLNSLGKPVLCDMSNQSSLAEQAKEMNDLGGQVQRNVK